MYQVYARPKMIAGIKFLDAVFSTRFEEPIEGDILIDEGEGQQYIHVQNRYVLLDINMLHNYKIVGIKIVETTEADKNRELKARPAPEKSEIEILQDTVECYEKNIYEMNEQLLICNEQLIETKQLLNDQIVLNDAISEYALSLEQRLIAIEEKKSKGEM